MCLLSPGLSLQRVGRWGGGQPLFIRVISGTWVMSGLSDAWDSLCLEPDWGWRHFFKSV